MSWITIIWSTEFGACLMMLLVHLLVWSRDRRSWANLCFSVAVMGVVGLAVFEMITMHAESPEVFGRALRSAHLVYGFGVVGSLGFVHFYFGTGRKRLLALALGLRLLAMVANLTTGQSLHIMAIQSLQKMSFLGEQVSVLGQWTPNPWVRLGQLASLVQLIYIVDASVRLWRTGSPESRKRAVIVGGSLAFFIIFVSGQAGLVAAGVLRMPFIVSLPFFGMVLGMGYELSRDVLRATRLSRELRESEQRLDLAASGGALGLWMWDIVRDQIWINDKGQSLFGFTPSEKPDIERFQSRIHPEDRESVRATVEKSLSTGAEYETEYRLVLPDGQVRWLNGRGRVEFNAGGKAARMHGVSIDITERKLGEEALRESEARFRTVANTAPVMIWMSGTDKLCTFFNKGWLDFTGRMLEQELGNGWAEGVHREDFDRCLAVYANSFDARQPFTMEYRLRRNDGKYGWVLDTGTPRFASDGTFLGYIGSCIDISARKQAEREALLMRQEIAHVGRVSLMGQLASALAHEINQPLGAILRNAEAAELFMQSASPDLDEIRAILADIRKDDQRAGSVIDRMRSLLKRRELDTRLLDVRELVSDVASLARADAAARMVKLDVNVSSGLPPVRGDRVHLQQVLLNLILNGMDALNGARPEARCVSVSARLDDALTVEIAVCDTGQGIPADEIAQVFDPFFTTKPNGMGMGLSISRTIIEAHGGRLWAENNGGGGATFRFTLRTVEAAAAI